MRETAFFLGKGGVGKTTLSSAFALTLARRGKKVLIASLDPAHNLGDSLKTTLAGEPKNVEPNLDALEVDVAQWVDKYLDDSRKQLKSTYSYNLTLNMDSFFKILKYSPGTEEYATLWAIEDVHCRLAPDYDIVVFDTPPTALSLRFLSLPALSGLWVEELTKLRERILERRQTITRLNPESPVAASCVDKNDDKVYGKLGSIRARLAALNTLFSKESFYQRHRQPRRSVGAGSLADQGRADPSWNSALGGLREQAGRLRCRLDAKPGARQSPSVCI